MHRNKILKKSIDDAGEDAGSRENPISIFINDLNTPREEELDFMKTLYEQQKIDIVPIGRNTIMDTRDLDVAEALEHFVDCDIYCFGMPNMDPEKLKDIIQENQSFKDWTYYLGDRRLSIICNSIINKSKKFQKDCEKYGVKFFDTSGDRIKKLEVVMKYIEDNSINC